MSKVEDYFEEDRNAETITEDLPKKEKQKGVYTEDPFVTKVLDEHKKTRYVKIGIGNGFIFGFGFGLGVFFAWIVIFIISTVLLGVTLKSLISSLGI